MRFLLLLGVLIWAGKGIAASVVIAPPASWVDDNLQATINVTPAADVAYGYDFLLIDNQVNVQADESYSRTVYRITAEGALQSGARFTWSFDPSYETLTLHNLRVIRDGVSQERLREGLVQIIQQESDLDRHMLNGRLTALVLLEDIRVGDVIEYASSRRGTNPVFGGKYINTYTTTWSVPVRHQRLRIIAPAGRPLIYKEHGQSGLNAGTIRSGDTVIHTWEGRDFPVVSNEDQTPSWFTPYSYLQVTEFTSWADVVAWAVPLYALPEPLPPAIAEKAARLTAGLAGDEEKAVALLKFVQQEIRYLGLELGPGTHRPNPPEQVLARRFGDCKDKVLLFCALMHATGLKAEPALVNTSYRDRISAWVATPYAFDHVIARVTLGDTHWWVDPTLNYQEGGVRYRGLPNYGLALPVGEGSDGLAAVVRPETALRRIEVDEQFDVTGFDEPARFKVVSRYKGLGAESLRSYFATTAIDEVTKAYVNYYAASYPGITSTRPVKWRDDPVANVLTVEEHYSVPDLWEKESDTGVRKAEFYPLPISDYAVQPKTRVRTMPLNISHPVTVELETRVNLHTDWDVEPLQNDVVDHAFRLNDSIVGKGRLVTMRYRWESLNDHVKPDQMADHVAAMTRARNRLGYHLTHTPPVATEEGAAVPEHFRFNWMPVVFILLAGGAVIYAGRRVYAWPAMLPPPLPGPGENNLVGLGGWLVLVGFGVVVRPLFWRCSS
jgi:transglutaminase-like putative cysteine protease